MTKQWECVKGCRSSSDEHSQLSCFIFFVPLPRCSTCVPFLSAFSPRAETSPPEKKENPLYNRFFFFFLHHLSSRPNQHPL